MRGLAHPAECSSFSCQRLQNLVSRYSLADEA